MRFSLRWLLIFVAFVAVGIASLRYASFFISGCLSVAWLVFLMVAILGAAYRRKQQRAFWFGCCVFGWSFTAYGMLSGNPTTAFDQAIQSLHRSLSWTAMVDGPTGDAHNQCGGDAFVDEYGLQTELRHMSNRRFTAKIVTITFPRRVPFEQAAGTLIGFFIAFVGGLVAQWFYFTRDRGLGGTIPAEPTNSLA